MAAAAVGPSATKPAGAASSELLGVVTAKRAAYYRRAVPRAQRFVAHAITADMLDPVDRGNDRYIEAFDARGRTIAYLRDFTGPVSPAAQCPCSPLSLTLVFNPDYSLRSLLSPQRLQKYGHAPMSDAEVARLITILKQAPLALTQVEQVEDMIDLTTGATPQALASVVVPQAALSTRRLMGLVQQSQNILRRGPGDRDRGRLNALLADARDEPRKQAIALGHWLAELPEGPRQRALRRQLWRALAHVFERASGPGTKPPDDVGRALVDARLLDAIEPDDMARLALRLARRADAGTLLPQARAVLAEDSRTSPALLAELRGTAALIAHQPQQALPDLEVAASTSSVQQAPELHLALCHALLASAPTRACQLAEAIYAEHPRLPGALEALDACLAPSDATPERPAQPDMWRQALASRLRLQQRQAFLLRLRPVDQAAPSPPLELQDDDGRAISLALADGAGRVTVLLFFATWCPHCRAELPQVRDFATSLGARGASGVRLVGIRTAIEREVTPYAEFARTCAPNFAVYTDCPMSQAFAAFSQAHDMPMTLPTTAIYDAQGRLRATLTPGEFSDVGEELGWAIEALAPQARSNAAKQVM